MKKRISFLLACLVCTALLFSCKDDNKENNTGNREINYNTLLRIIPVIDWLDNQIPTQYAKVPSMDNPQWVDIVLASDDINDNSLESIGHYVYIHINISNINTDSILNGKLTLEDNFQIIYYHNRKTAGRGIDFDCYMQKTDGVLEISGWKSDKISGKFSGTMKDMVNSPTVYPAILKFTDVSVSLAKKAITESNFLNGYPL